MRSTTVVLADGIRGRSRRHETRVGASNIWNSVNDRATCDHWVAVAHAVGSNLKLRLALYLLLIFSWQAQGNVTIPALPLVGQGRNDLIHMGCRQGV